MNDLHAVDFRQLDFAESNVAAVIVVNSDMLQLHPHASPVNESLIREDAEVSLSFALGWLIADVDQSEFHPARTKTRRTAL